MEEKRRKEAGGSKKTDSPKQADDLEVGWNVLARLLGGDELELVEGAVGLCEKEGEG